MKYNVILADPPWKYKSDLHDGSASTDHYPSMTNQELKDLDVKSICDNGWDVYGNEVTKFDKEE